ncbi:MAG: hypothetical protein FWC92_07840 [Defluviitaleaceae bacterium]|nr:hypothetical protein [Defluviitaleaceae bacterium]
MCKTTINLAKTNLRHLQVPYVLTGILAGIIAVQMLVFVILGQAGMDVNFQSLISVGNFLWLLPLLAAIFIPARNFRRVINLGGKRENFFWGSLMAYSVLAAIVSLANIVIFYAIDRPVIRAGHFHPFHPFEPGAFVMSEPGHIGGVANLVEVFGWAGNGMLLAFLQQFALLFLISAFVHTLTAIQVKWYGWVADVALIAIISVFTPIPVLRRALVWFFNLIIFHDVAVLQVAACIVLALGIYMINKPVLARRAI